MAQTYIQDSQNDDLFDFFENNNYSISATSNPKSGPMREEPKLLENTPLPEDAIESISSQIVQIGNNIELTSAKEEKTNIDCHNEVSLDEEKANVCSQSSVLHALFMEKEINKIYIQNYNSIYIERNGKKECTTLKYSDENALKTDLMEIIDKSIEVRTKTPYFAEILLPGGIVLSYIFPPLSQVGITATFTFPNKDLLKSKDFVHKEILSKEMLYFLERCVRSGINIMISGNCHEMQIELLNLLNSFIKETDTITSIDGKHELKFSHNNVNVINERIANKESVNAFYIAQQLKPDRITLNELNASNVEDFLYLSVMTEKGCTTTLYANSPKHACIHRIPLLYKTALNTSKDLEFLPTQINEALQIIVHITKVANNKYKVTNICHVDGVAADGNVNLKDIFLYNKTKETFEQPGYIPKKIIKIIKDNDIPFDDSIFQKSSEE